MIGFPSTALDVALIIVSFGARSRPKRLPRGTLQPREEKVRNGRVEAEGGHDHGATEMNP